MKIGFIYLAHLSTSGPRLPMWWRGMMADWAWQTDKTAKNGSNRIFTNKGKQKRTGPGEGQSLTAGNIFFRQYDQAQSKLFYLIDSLLATKSCG